MGLDTRTEDTECKGLPKSETRGGKRKGAGRPKDLIPKKKMTVSVPVKYEKTIKERVKKLVNSYIEKCKREI